MTSSTIGRHQLSAISTSLARHGSEVQLDEWVAPDACDEVGCLRAGKILEWMDVVGALAASRYGRLPAVTVSIDGGTLLGRIGVGDRITMRAQVAHTSTRTVGIAVSMHASSPARPVFRGYMTFVVIGDDGRPAGVPEFVPQTPEEIALHGEGALRRSFHLEHAARAPTVYVAPIPFARTEASLLDRILSAGAKLVARTPPRARPRSDSYVHRIEPVRAGKLNFHGTLYGGTLLRWIETCAAMSARAHVDHAVELVAFDGLSFVRPVPASVFVHLTGTAVHADDLGVTVLVRATAEDPLTGGSVETLRGHLTYTPVDRSVDVPGLVVSTSDEAAEHAEVLARFELRSRLRALGIH